jgi:hypothetical protein
MLAALATCSTPEPGLLQTTKVILAFVYIFTLTFDFSLSYLTIWLLNFWMIFSALLPASAREDCHFSYSLCFLPERRAQTFARYFLKNEIVQAGCSSVRHREAKVR